MYAEYSKFNRTVVEFQTAVKGHQISNFEMKYQAIYEWNNGVSNLQKCFH